MSANVILSGVDLAGLRVVAGEALNAFAVIAAAARTDLGRRGVNLGDLAIINQATVEATAQQMREINDQRIGDSQRLCREPAIARLVIADENDQRETLYISSSGTVAQGAVRLCSYMSPKGQLAPLGIGDYRLIDLPGGRRTYEVIEKITFKPFDLVGEWDAQPAIQFREQQAPLTIKSLRELLRQDGADEETIDEIELWLSGAGTTNADDNVSEGIKRDALTAMQLRVAPILNEFQDKIFRLPIDSQIAVMGPPGTGKTTTLVRRLRQKIDLAYLNSEESALVERPDADGRTHTDSWIMFTPTELLRLYVKEAFAKEGVPAQDGHIRTWDDYRREIARNNLGILKRAKGPGLVLRDDDSMLLPSTLVDQIAWFEAFDTYQQTTFVSQLSAEAERLAEARDSHAAALGGQISKAIARSGDRPLQLLADLAARSDRLRTIANNQRDDTRVALRNPLRDFNRARPGFLDELTRFVEALDDDRFDDDDNGNTEGDDEEGGEREWTLRGARLAEDVFIKAMRSRAIGQASGRLPAAGTRAGRMLAWIVDIGMTLPDLKQVGAALLVQRAALRLDRAPEDYLARIPLRYRQFRRSMRDQLQWYGETKFGAQDAHPAEIDVIMLAILRTARAMERDRLLTQRLTQRRPPMLDDIARLRRYQVLVDEATDFSPVQLANMRHLTHLETESLFLSGDFNQRLTRWGSRSEEELRWVSPEIQIESINISYRQSRKLADFARKLARTYGYDVNDQPPEHIDNLGWEPVLGKSLATTEDQALWLSARIREIEGLTNGTLPTIAILVADGAALDPLADALSVKLGDMNIRAVACPKGLVKGQPGDVRIFEVEHIKGLEFEAVFFMDIDRLNHHEPDLFVRYVYVGATRAATFLGLGCKGRALPETLSEFEHSLLQAW